MTSSAKAQGAPHAPEHNESPCSCSVKGSTEGSTDPEDPAALLRRELAERALLNRMMHEDL